MNPDEVMNIADLEGDYGYEPEPIIYPEDGFWGEPVEGDRWSNGVTTWEYVLKLGEDEGLLYGEWEKIR